MKIYFLLCMFFASETVFAMKPSDTQKQAIIHQEIYPPTTYGTQMPQTSDQTIINIPQAMQLQLKTSDTTEQQSAYTCLHWIRDDWQRISEQTKLKMARIAGVACIVTLTIIILSIYFTINKHSKSHNGTLS